MSQHNIDGATSEQKVAECLASQGYKILDQNWKNRWAEIDIIAVKDKCVHFVEVKYRKSSEYGSGFEYVTSSKQRQMTFAAEMWINQNKNYDEYVLSAAEVSGPEFAIELIEQI